MPIAAVQVGPPKPPSPVPEGVEEEASPAKGGVFKDHSTSVTVSRGTDDSFAQERSRLKSDLQKVCDLVACCLVLFWCVSWSAAQSFRGEAARVCSQHETRWVHA